MSYRYLTRSYVEWLGLERVPIYKPRSGAMCILGNDTLPMPTNAWPEGVVHDATLYERESDGLAYARLRTA